MGSSTGDDPVPAGQTMEGARFRSRAQVPCGPPRERARERAGSGTLSASVHANGASPGDWRESCGRSGSMSLQTAPHK